MKTEKIKLSQININARNPRKISDKQLERLVRSILIFPEMQTLRPIVIDETYTALGGNMRYRALTAISEKSPAEINMMLANGCKGYAQKTEAERQNLRDYWAAWLADPTAIIVRADQLTEEQKREFIIKDNVAFGEWDDETLTSFSIGVSETLTMSRKTTMPTRMTTERKMPPTHPHAATPAMCGNSDGTGLCAETAPKKPM